MTLSPKVTSLENNNMPCRGVVFLCMMLKYSTWSNPVFSLKHTRLSLEDCCAVWPTRQFYFHSASSFHSGCESDRPQNLQDI